MFTDTFDYMKAYFVLKKTAGCDKGKFLQITNLIKVSLVAKTKQYNTVYCNPVYPQ